MSSGPSNHPHARLRTDLRPNDVAAIGALVEATGMFHAGEIKVAIELVGETLHHGSDCGYRFTILEAAGSIIGYACFGPIPCTASSWDLYWIAVHPDHQKRGFGKQLLDNVEQRIAREGGTRLYVDTSGRESYLPTRRFYERMGYAQAAMLPDFYAPQDARIIYSKLLSDG